MDWIQYTTLIGAFASGFGFLLREMRRVESRLDAQGKRTDAQIDAQCKRTDKLYEMFIDLLKEVKK